MKKMIIAAAAIIVAVASQAAVVDWGYKITGDKTVASTDAAKASAYANNYMVYLFAADAVADWSKLKAADLALAADKSALAYQTYSSRNGAQYATSSTGGVVGGARAVDAGEAAVYEAVFVVVDTANNKYAYTTADIATRSEQAGAGSAGVQSFTQANFAAQSFNSFAANVPEPTSGLLLLLGMAGLALRRKQA